MPRIVTTQPTEMHFPARYPGGPAQRVFVCELGCLVLQDMVPIHAQAAHS